MQASGPPAKETAFNLNKYIDQKIRVKFSGGREGMLHHAVIVFVREVVII